MQRTLVLTFGLLLAVAMPGAAQISSFAFPSSEPRTSIMLLGTFHFKDAGLDSYKPKFPANILSETRQREVEDLVERLARFAPTKVAVESKRQAMLDSLYSEYRAGRWQLTENEIYQVGFRLAAKLKHDRVYAVDAPSNTYFPGMKQAQYDSLVARLGPIDTTWDARYRKFYQWQDSVKTTVTLVDYLSWMNDPRNAARGHGGYLVGGFELRSDSSFFGPDFESYWWNRNLRMFSNLQRLSSTPNDRILFIVGAGHLELLRHSIQTSPKHRLVEANAFLGGPRATAEDSTSWGKWQTFATGSWSCAGAFANGTKLEADMKFEPGLGGKWLRYEHVDRAPGKFEASASWGFQAGTGRLISNMQDNFGGARLFEGTLNGDELTWKADPTFSPARYAERFIFKREGEAMRMTWEVSQNERDWRMGDYLVCTRAGR